jgi:hypothetical protein
MKESFIRKNRSQGKRGVVGSIFVILVLTFLEFPKPMGFETRSQDNVARGWLVLFAAIVISEIAAMILVFGRPGTGAWLAIVAASLNIFQIVADQTHMMQPEVAPLGYSVLEYSVGIVSLGLIYFAWKVLRPKTAL